MENIYSITVIIPVYNMELYITRCLDSIINQTYKNLEIIVINDGSTDNSYKIIEEYAFRDNRMKIINKENEGIGSAYIDALKIATGDYITFVDADDYIDKNTYSTVLKWMKEKSIDIIQYGRDYVCGDKVIRTMSFPQQYINHDIAVYQYSKIKHPNNANRLYNRRLFHNIQLLKQNIGIDDLIVLQMVLRAKTLYIIPDIFYHVNVRENSVCRSKYNSSLICQNINVFNLMLQVCWENLYVRNIIIIRYIGSIQSISKQFSESVYYNIKKLKQDTHYKGLFKDIKSTNEFKNLPFTTKMSMFLFRYCSLIFYAIKRKQSKNE